MAVVDTMMILLDGKMKGRKPDEWRKAEIKRLYGLGHPIVQIAHTLRCSESVVSSHLPVKNGVKAKVGAKPGISSPSSPLRNLEEDKIAQMFAGQIFDDEPNAARFKNQEER
jgi:hypothetical protein